MPSFTLSVALTFAFAVAAFVGATRMASAPLDPDLV
jgi:hypothetical protein